MPDLDAQVDYIEDDVLRLIFLSCHPSLTPESRAALTLRLDGGGTQALPAPAIRKRSWSVASAGRSSSSSTASGSSEMARPRSEASAATADEQLGRFLRLRRGPAYAVAYRIAMALTALSRLCVLGLVRVLGLGLFRSTAIDSGLRKWRSVLRWTLGAESWVRNPGAGH